MVSSSPDPCLLSADFDLERPLCLDRRSSERLVDCLLLCCLSSTDLDLDRFLLRLFDFSFLLFSNLSLERCFSSGDLDLDFECLLLRCFGLSPLPLSNLLLEWYFSSGDLDLDLERLLTWCFLFSSLLLPERCFSSGDLDLEVLPCFDLLSSGTSGDIFFCASSTTCGDGDLPWSFCLAFSSLLPSSLSSDWSLPSADFDLDRLLYFDFLSPSFGDDLLLRPCSGDNDSRREALLVLCTGLSRRRFGEPKSAR